MAHIHKLIDFIVNIFIVYDGKVLLIHHRKLDKWLPIGGHIELDEDPEEALFREIKEECGLEIELLSSKPDIVSKGTKFLHPPTFLDIHDILDSHKHIGLIYFAKAKTENFIFNEKEHKDIKWFSEEDLEKEEYNLGSDIKFYAKHALNKINK